ARCGGGRRRLSVGRRTGSTVSLPSLPEPLVGAAPLPAATGLLAVAALRGGWFAGAAALPGAGGATAPVPAAGATPPGGWLAARGVPGAGGGPGRLGRRPPRRAALAERDVQ